MHRFQTKVALRVARAHAKNGHVSVKNVCSLSLKRILDSRNYSFKTIVAPQRIPRQRFVFCSVLVHRAKPTMATPTTAVLFGSTGLLGQHLLPTLLATDTYQAIHTISRRAPKPESPKLTAHVETDTSKWASALAALSPTPSIVVSALGSTRVGAGSIENQWKIDHDRELLCFCTFCPVLHPSVC